MRSSSASAKAKLLRASSFAKLITTMKRPLDPDPLPIEFWVRIDPREWSARTVDYDGPDADGCEIDVMIHEDDFRSWIKQQCDPQFDREAAITKRLRAGVPGRDISWKQFCNDVRKDCEALPTTHGFSNETIEDITRKNNEGS